MIFAQYKVKMRHISQIMYIFCRFDEVSAIRKPKMRTFLITGSQIFFVNFVIFATNERKSAYQFIIHNTNKESVKMFYSLCLVGMKFSMLSVVLGIASNFHGRLFVHFSER